MDAPANNLTLPDEEMTVYVLVKKTVAMKVRLLEKVGSIKSAFYKKEGICENDQELFINGDQLKDDQTVADCGIREGSTLHMILQSNGRVKLLVQVPSKRTSIVIEARACYSIRLIKYLILEKEGIEPNQYNLIYAGRVLDDDTTLSSLGMQNESATLQLVFNPCDTISFSVTTPTERSVHLNVKVLYSVFDVKAIIGGLIGTSVSDCSLVYQGKQLEDFKALACYDVQEGSVLQMFYSKFQIFVKAWSGKTITLDVQPSDTVEVVKDKACSKLGLPNCFLRILHGGKYLELKHDLAYYSISKHATLHMVFSPSTMKMKLSDIGSLALGVPNSETTIRDLKAIIQKKVTSQVKEIYFCNMLLDEDLTIGHYKIDANDSITVTFVSEKVGDRLMKNATIAKSLVI